MNAEGTSPTMATPAHMCPWCPYTDAALKKVLQHMASLHAQRWCDLALSPPVAGGGVT